MKADTGFRISLAFNGIAFVCILGLAARDRGPEPRADVAHPVDAAAHTHGHGGHSHGKPASPLFLRSSGPVEGVDPAGVGWVMALREAGIDEKRIADFAASEFESRWQQHWNEMEARFESGELDETAYRQWSGSHDIERARHLRAVLGEEGFRRWEKGQLLKHFDLDHLHLSAAGTDDLYRLEKHLKATLRDLEQSFQRGEIDGLDFQELSQAERGKYEKQLENLLGEHHHALHRHEHGGGEFRRALLEVKASEAQQEALLQAQAHWQAGHKALQNQLQKGELTEGDFELRFKELNAAREKEFVRELGTDGFTEFTKVRDSRYRELKRFAPAWNLSDADIEAIYLTLRSSEANLDDYRERARVAEAQGQPVDWGEVQTTAELYSRDTEKALLDYLGEERFMRLKQNAVLPGAPAGLQESIESP